MPHSCPVSPRMGGVRPAKRTAPTSNPAGGWPRSEIHHEIRWRVTHPRSWNLDPPQIPGAPSFAATPGSPASGLGSLGWSCEGWVYRQSPPAPEDFFREFPSKIAMSSPSTPENQNNRIHINYLAAKNSWHTSFPQSHTIEVGGKLSGEPRPLPRRRNPPQTHDSIDFTK